MDSADRDDGTQLALDALPTELIQRIAGYLDTESAIRLIQVNRRLNATCDSRHVFQNILDHGNGYCQVFTDVPPSDVNTTSPNASQRHISIWSRREAEAVLGRDAPLDVWKRYALADLCAARFCSLSLEIENKYGHSAMGMPLDRSSIKDLWKAEPWLMQLVMFKHPVNSCGHLRNTLLWLMRLAGDEMNEGEAPVPLALASSYHLLAYDRPARNCWWTLQNRSRLSAETLRADNNRLHSCIARHLRPLHPAAKHARKQPSDGPTIVGNSRLFADAMSGLVVIRNVVIGHAPLITLVQNNASQNGNVLGGNTYEHTPDLSEVPLAALLGGKTPLPFSSPTPVPASSQDDWDQISKLEKTIPLSKPDDNPFASWHSWSTFHLPRLATTEAICSGEWVGYYFHFERGEPSTSVDPMMTDIHFHSDALAERLASRLAEPHLTFTGLMSGDLQVRRKPDPAASLAHQNCIALRARGQDNVGHFELGGEVDKTSGRVTLKKLYDDPSLRWRWDGMLTMFGIVGTWGDLVTPDTHPDGLDDFDNLRNLGGWFWIWNRDWFADGGLLFPDT